MIERRHKGLVAQRFARGSLWATRGRHVLARDGDGPFRPVVRVSVFSGASAERLPWLAQAARWGVHGLLPLDSGALLAVTRGRLVRRAPSGRWRTTMALSGWHRPTRNGLTIDGRGRVWLAQYARNRARAQPMQLWRSDDDGLSFAPALTLPAGDVRHIHFVAHDPVDGATWCGTGDRDAECRLYRSADGDGGFELIGGGDQRWRAVGLALLADAIVWGTDAGRDRPDYGNRILRMCRKTGQIEELGRLSGPVHGVTSTADGDVLLSTGVEGGGGERSERVQLWLGRGGRDFRPLTSFAAGAQPRRVQYAVAQFVPGQQTRPTTAPIPVVLRGVAGMALGTVELRLPA